MLVMYENQAAVSTKNTMTQCDLVDMCNASEEPVASIFRVDTYNVFCKRQRNQVHPRTGHESPEGE